MGRKLQIEWQETAEQLKQLYKRERHPQRRIRLLALWHLRQGKLLTRVSEMVCVPYRVLQRWVAWYRQGGLSEVLRRVTGYQARGVEPYLNPTQQRALAARVELGDFKTVWAVAEWVKDRWGIGYSYKGLYSLMKRLDLKVKVPRPHSEKADTQQQEAWKKGA